MKIKEIKVFDWDNHWATNISNEVGAANVRFVKTNHKRGVAQTNISNDYDNVRFVKTNHKRGVAQTNSKGYL